ncbi:hypothetical protein LXA43DRAFT_946929 [Ganoderma leucocontextum]|nr:hypothetical protein LXA43DRAFT_946929 [Ganoderma leucocontextum]
MYKSSNFRKSQPQTDSPSDKYHTQAKQLQEAFPSWSYDDLQSLLLEVGGDAELASTRIIEGRAEQWGSVTRKKDKKLSSSPSYTKDSTGRDRGEHRGGRGGRAARGGPRGGAARGAGARGAHHEVNGHRAKPSVSGQTPKESTAAESATPAPVNGEAPDPDAEASVWSSSTPATWGGDTAAINGAAAASAATPASAQAPTSGPAKAVSTPATSKLSWAQIARKQEKPAPAAAPGLPPVPVSVSTPPPAPVQYLEPTTPPETTEPVAATTGWEEPTTIQAPTWDDEPRASEQVESVFVPSVAEEVKPAQSDPTPSEDPVPEHVPAAVPPGIVLQPSAPESPVALPPKPLTPSVSTRPTPAPHRTTAKFKTTDQPVVLPASFGSGVEKIGMQFGSLSLGGEDFDGSIQEPAPGEQNAVQPAAPEPAPAPVAQLQEPAAPIMSPSSQTSLSSAPHFQSSISQPSQQPSQPQQAPQLSTVSQQAQQSTLPTSLTQPSLSTQTTLPSSSAASISPYSQHSQPSLASHQTQQPQSQAHHSYGQHGLQTHLDQVQSQQQQQQQQHTAPSASQQQQPATVGQGPNLGGPSSYFRQPEAPYFHTATPPAGQNQDSPYGAFGQLGQHQGQGSHLGNFGGTDYGYGESQRNFYDSYSGPTGFGNRNALGHDDLGKTLPGSQQPHAAAPGLPPASAQSSQQHPGAPSSQTSSQGQPNAGQGPQQGYPPPLPYYYPPYPQSQYYGSPYNSGYTVPQPFVKYPAVFQGPPGPQSAPSPAAKQVQGPSSVQPQSPYAQSLYGQHQQHPSNAYDELGGYQPHHTQHQHSVGQNVGSGLPSSEYGKHQGLYGAGSQGMQSFMGLGQSSAPSGGPPGALGQRAAGGSPENAYKPYGGNVGVKDVSGGVGVAQGVSQGPQGGRGVQQPGQGSFYAQRFAASQGAGPQGQQVQQPQGQGPQGHLGYPQGGSDASGFYSYQPRQQQGYWQ